MSFTNVGVSAASAGSDCARAREMKQPDASVLCTLTFCLARRACTASSSSCLVARAFRETAGDAVVYPALVDHGTGSIEKDGLRRPPRAEHLGEVAIHIFVDREWQRCVPWLPGGDRQPTRE